MGRNEEKGGWRSAYIKSMFLFVLLVFNLLVTTPTGSRFDVICSQQWGMRMRAVGELILQGGKRANTWIRPYKEFVFIGVISVCIVGGKAEERAKRKIRFYENNYFFN